MDISNALSNAYLVNRLDSRARQANVNETAAIEPSVARDTQTRDRVQTEQNEIIDSLRANARTLQASGERVGTLIDVQA
jgi:hypothetical protein